MTNTGFCPALACSCALLVSVLILAGCEPSYKCDVYLATDRDPSYMDNYSGATAKDAEAACEAYYNGPKICGFPNGCGVTCSCSAPVVVPDASAPLPGVTPSVSISSPTNNSSLNLPAEKTIPVNFATNYSLKAPGTCAGAAKCGHVYLSIDNTSCNLPKFGYNALVISSPGEADFSKCASSTGIHTISLELHNDDGSVVLNILNNPVTALVTITTQ